MLELTITVTAKNWAYLRQAVADIADTLGPDNMSGTDTDGLNGTTCSFEISGEEEAANDAVVYLGLNQQTDHWQAICTVHGVVAAAPGGDEGGHDDMLVACADHKQSDHGGDGVVPPSAWLDIPRA